MKPEKIILGIDPGTTIMGYGLIKSSGQRIEMVALGIIDMRKLENQALKLKRIFERTLGIIDEFKPDELAIEAPFFGKNVQSMLKLGRAQGVAIAAGLYREVSMTEYSPKKIKQSITGNGNASKEQVAAMLKSILKLRDDQMPKQLDATDGLAAAVCHHFQGGGLGNQKKYTGWSSFVKNNPSKVSKG